MIVSDRVKRSITLLLLAPTIPELLTGSTPPWALMNPINLLVLIVLYGFPAAILREYARKRGLGYHRLLILGMLQGVLVEGLAVNTFYSDDRGTLGLFSSYGRVMGVNWNWALYLTFFHSIYSVLVPVMLVDSIHSDGPLVSVGAPHAAAVAGVVLLFNLSEGTYKPPLPYYLLSLLLIPLIFLAFRWQDDRPMLWRGMRFPPSGLWSFAPLFLIVAFYGLANLVHPVIHAIVGVLLYASLYNALRSTHDPWKVSRDLLVGLSVTGLIVALLNGRYYIVPPALAFVLLSAYWELKIGRRAALDPEGDAMEGT